MAHSAALGLCVAVRVGNSGGRGRQLLAHLRPPHYRRRPRRVAGRRHRLRRPAGERPLGIVGVVHEGDPHLEGLAHVLCHRPVGLCRRPDYFALASADHTQPLVGVSVALGATLGIPLAVPVGDGGRPGQQLFAHLHPPQYQRRPRRVAGRRHRRRRLAGERPLVIAGVVPEGDPHLQGLALVLRHRHVGVPGRPGYVALVRTVHKHPPVAVGVAPIAGFGPGRAVHVGDAGRRRRQHLAHLHPPRYRRRPRGRCRTGHDHRVGLRRAPCLGGRHRDLVAAPLQSDLVSLRRRVRIGRQDGHVDARLRSRRHGRRRNEVRHPCCVERRVGLEPRPQRGVGECETGELRDARHQAAVHLVL